MKGNKMADILLYLFIGGAILGAVIVFLYYTYNK